MGLESISGRARAAFTYSFWERIFLVPPWVYPVVFFTVLANIPYWCASQMLALRMWGWFCVQYLTVGLLALLLPAWAATAMFVLVVLADLLSATCATYMLSLKDCLDNVGNYMSLSAPRQLAVVVVVVLLLLAASIVYSMNLSRLARRVKVRIAASLGVAMVLLLAADLRTVARNTGAMPNPFSTRAQSDGVNFALLPDQSRLVRIPEIRLVRLAIAEARIRASLHTGPAQPIGSATALALKLAGMEQRVSADQAPNFVLVLVESWGHPAASPMEDALLEPYLQPEVADRYRVVRGTMPFHGTTIAGEARELCGKAFGYALIDEPAQQLQGCLPARLARMGYHSIAVHGLSGAMFHRERWYRTIGFDQRLFHDDLQNRGLPDCAGAFAGTCDTAIAAWVGDELERSNQAPLFVHWVTLNSHLPVPGALPAACKAELGLAPGTALCSWFQLQLALHRAVAQAADQVARRPTVFVIVGDHAPPFVDDQTRSLFSSDHVPYLLLIPRQHELPQDRTLVHAISPDRPAHRTLLRLNP